MLFEWFSDPAAWAGLATLIILEIVLGIDNLVFIAVLAEKLPPHQRDRARVLGLSLALGMRLILLASIAWIVTLQSNLFTIFGNGFSGRDLILIFGGLFLLFKGTVELHERLEGHHAPKEQNIIYASFAQVLLQIVVLDAVFSLDSVITAVGMVKHLSIMYIAVIVAMGVMLAMAKPLMSFVSRHPTVVILCLGFLMMIGFSLIVEGFDFHIPKGYLYAAIGFSVLIEAFNQIGRRNREKYLTSGDLRDRTAEAVLRLLGGKKGEVELGGSADVMAERAAEQELFVSEEKAMIQGVLGLSERPATSIMTPRTEVAWIDLDEDESRLRDQILDEAHSRFVIARGSLDNFIGVALSRDMLRDIATTGTINATKSVRDPLVVHEGISVLKLMEKLRRAPVQLAVLVDEFGTMQGVATPTDVLEAIAGEFPDEDEEAAVGIRNPDGSWTFDGWIDIRRVSSLLETDLEDETERYSTLAGYVLSLADNFPAPGESVESPQFRFEILSHEGHALGRVRVIDRKQAAQDAALAAES